MGTTYANYESFNTYAEKIANRGELAYTRVKEAYEALADLNKADGWKGVRYDSVVESFNSMVTEFNNIFSDVQEKIPKSLQTIASQFAAFDTSSITKTDTDSDTISSITKSGTTALTWNETNVTAAQTKINTKFNSAKVDIDAIETIVVGMSKDWSGESYDNLLGKIQSYKTKVDTSLDNLMTDFKTYMDQAKEDFNSAETKANSALEVGE